MGIEVEGCNQIVLPERNDIIVDVRAGGVAGDALARRQRLNQ